MQKLNGSASKDFVAAQQSGLLRDKRGRILATGVDHTGEAYRNIYGKRGESPEQRAFRRFPIDGHKPGGR